MAKFKKKQAQTSQEISTASLPDIVFMLLFFFMVTTVIRETNLLVTQRLPMAEQLVKLERQSLISYIYIGTPKNVSRYGDEPRIQVNDVLITTDDLILFVNQQREKLPEAERDQITMSLKVDKEAKMGIVSDVQEELREANARKIMYSTPKEIEQGI